MQNEIAASHTTGLKTHVSARESKDSLLDCRSGSSTQFDDGQMLSPFDVADREPQLLATRTAATRSVRPVGRRLKPSPLCSEAARDSVVKQSEIVERCGRGAS